MAHKLIFRNMSYSNCIIAVTLLPAQENKFVGTTFTNIQVFTPTEQGKNKLEIVLNAVRQWVIKDGFEEIGADEQVEPELLRTVIITSSEPDPWTGIYDEFGNEYLDNLRDYALFISKATGFPTVSNLTFDSDVIEIGLFKSGEEIDFYSSDPGYGEGRALSGAEKVKLKGTPELWQEFLISGKTPAHLRSVWNKKPIFAEEIQATTAQFFGMSEFADGGFGYFEYLDQMGKPAAVTRLRFRVKSTKSSIVTGLKGLPILELAGHSRQVYFSVGKELGHFAALFICIGSPSKGLQIVFWGSALDKGLIVLDKINILRPDKKSKYNKLSQDYDLTKFEDSDKKGFLVDIPDFEIPFGLNVKSENEATSPAEWERIFKLKRDNEIMVIPSGKALNPGFGYLDFAFIPFANRQAGQASYTIEVTVNEPAS